jgi:hypothetical protein
LSWRGSRRPAVERIFGTRLAVFGASLRRVLAPERDARLPAPLRGRVDVLLGLRAPLDAPPARAAKSAAAGASLPQPTGRRRGCAAGLGANGFTPNQLRTTYGLDAFHRRGLTGQGRGSLFEVASLRRSDLRTYTISTSLDDCELNWLTESRRAYLLTTQC